ncbi:hypothetical protein PspLS_06664 [Pyricularia sp. CBS 133598]|nr:hypothetical protein PspLS_06664 [Pyricularia sp. CBS 133598]
MVLLASSRSLARSLGPLASRSRAFQSSAASRSLSTATHRGQAKSTTLLRPTAATRTSSLLSTGSSFRMLTTQREKVKVLLVLYDGGQHAKDVPELLGTTENELGIRKWLEDQGHTLVTTSDKDGENSTFDKELEDAEIIITTPFHPGYLSAERLARAKKLKLAVTAGIGSDHVDLNAANKTNGGITVAEVTGSNVVSVAEHVLMTILVLVRNFVPAHEMIQAGEWDVAGAAKNEYDLEGKVVGTVAVGRIGERVLRRLKPFDCKELLYYDYQPLAPEVEKEIGCRRVDNLEEMLAQCDVVTINCPLHEKTRGLFNKDLISKMKKGSWLVNTARGAIVVKEDVADALASGHLRGYGGDVWFPQPAPKDHPLRYAKNPFGGGNAMVPHMSGTSLDAQKRYADGTKAILESYLSGKLDYRPQDLIVHAGDYATKAYGGLPALGSSHDIVNRGGLRILDICTGTGCIPLLLGSRLTRRGLVSEVRGVDISHKALRLARDNTAHNRELVRSCEPQFQKLDVFAAEDAHTASSLAEDGSWDVVTCNPPYISEAGFARDTTRSVRNFEPRNANVPEERDLGGLYGTVRPEDVFYARVLDMCQEHLRPRVVFFEVGDLEQAKRVATMALQVHAQVEIWRDLPDVMPDGDDDGLSSISIDGVTVAVKGSGHGRGVLIQYHDGNGRQRHS